MKDNAQEYTNNPETQGLGVVFPLPAMRRKELTWFIPMAVISTSRVVSELSDFSTRNILPEPLDIPDHIGNTAMTFVILSFFSKGLWGKNAIAMTPVEHEQSRKKFAITLGVVTVAANIYAEKIGWSQFNTPDYLDFVYGCIGGALAYKAMKPNYMEPSTVDYALTSLEEINPLKVKIQKAIKTKQDRTSITHVDNTTKNKRNEPNRKPNTKKIKSKMQKKSRKQNRKK